jgi:hypothetical protein
LILHVQVRRDQGQETFQVTIPHPPNTLMDVFKIIFTLDWGKSLFQEADQGQLKVKAGILVVLNNRMIQAWDFDNTVVVNDDHLRFVPVVAGG